MEDIKTITPTINLNGTSREALLEQKTDLLHALREAQAALRRATPNGRDYQLADPSWFERALERHTRQCRVLAKLVEEVMDEAEAILESE